MIDEIPSSFKGLSEKKLNIKIYSPAINWDTTKPIKTASTIRSKSFLGFEKICISLFTQ